MPGDPADLHQRLGYFGVRGIGDPASERLKDPVLRVIADADDKREIKFGTVLPIQSGHQPELFRRELVEPCGFLLREAVNGQLPGNGQPSREIRMRTNQRQLFPCAGAFHDLQELRVIFLDRCERPKRRRPLRNPRGMLEQRSGHGDEFVEWQLIQRDKVQSHGRRKGRKKRPFRLTQRNSRPRSSIRMQLLHSQYGKSAVGLLKIFRDGPIHTVKEITVSALVTGEFSCAFLEGENATTVPTDTIKNTIYALARDQFRLDGIEAFGLRLARHFLDKYPAFSGITIELRERGWDRMEVGGVPQPHAFHGSGNGIRTASVRADRTGAPEVTAGISEFEILKSTGSGFIGFPRCEFTTLPETTDRIMATLLHGSWRFSRLPDDYNRVHTQVREAFLEVFSTQYSRAVQETLFRMASLALERVPELDQVTLRLPNLHYFACDLARFGMTNNNEIFHPAPNPHGDISATVSR